MKRRILIFLLAALTVLVGCERRELEYGSAALSLKIKVNGKIQNLPTPEMISLASPTPTFASPSNTTTLRK